FGGMSCEARSSLGNITMQFFVHNVS
ncbi:hypothetical protein CCACVL1_29075, partial [Corchorus capsularis]